MSAKVPGVYVPPPPPPPPERLPVSGVWDKPKLSEASNIQEIENLKRLLAHIGQRLDALKTR